MHIYYLYSTVSTDTDHIRFLQIVIDDSNWGLAGTYGCFNRQPSQGGVHRHHGSGRLAEVYSMPYKNNGIWLLSQVHLARSCWMANRIEMEGTQDPWLSGQIGLLSLGKPIYVLFSGIGVRYGCPQHCIYIYIHIYAQRSDFWVLFDVWFLRTFMVEAPSALHVFSSMAGAGPVGPRLRWRDEGPVTLCWEMGCLRVLDLFQICKKNTVKEACLLLAVSVIFRCALLMNKAWLRNHRRFRNRDLETTAQELPFRNYGSCTKVQELWLEKDLQRFRPLRLLLVCGTLKECESCRRHFVRVQPVSFCEHLCNCHYIQSLSPLAWIGMSFC